MSTPKLLLPQIQITMLVAIAETWGLYLLFDAYDMPGTYIVPSLTIVIYTAVFFMLYSNCVFDEIKDAETLKLALGEVKMKAPAYGVGLYIAVALIPCAISFAIKLIA